MNTNIDRAAEVISLALADDADVSIAGNYNDIMNVSEATLDGKYDLTAVARALADAGLLKADLPKPRMIGRRGALGGLRAEWRLGFDTVIADGPHVWCGGYMEPLTSAEARALGLALLAATADHAEEVGTHE